MALPIERLDTFSGDSVNNMIATAALGQIPDASIVYISGHTTSIAGGSTSLLWKPDGAIGTTNCFPSGTVTAYVSSSSASDIGNIIKVTALDANYNIVEYGVTLNGTTAIPLPAQIIRVNLLQNMGTTATVGDVYIGTETTPIAGIPARANTINMYGAEDQVSHTAIFTVPKGYVLLVEEFGGSTPTADSILVNAKYSTPGTNVFKSGMHLATYRGTVSQKAALFPLPEKTDIYLSATAYTNNTDAYGFLFGILLPNKYSK